MITKQLRLRATVQSRSDANEHLNAPGDAVLVDRRGPRWLLLSCPCGCGEIFPINLDPRVGPAWRLFRKSAKNLTVYPSVWRESGCHSHYIIWRGNILLFGQYEDDLEAVISNDEIGALADEVLKRLGYDELVPFATIAESFGADPWDVLTTCRRLVARGLAHEGRGKQSGSFCKARQFDRRT